MWAYKHGRRIHIDGSEADQNGFYSATTRFPTRGIGDRRSSRQAELAYPSVRYLSSAARSLHSGFDQAWPQGNYSPIKAGRDTRMTPPRPAPKVVSYPSLAPDQVEKAPYRSPFDSPTI